MRRSMGTLMRFVLLITALLALHPWLGHAVADDPCGGIGKKAAQAIIEGAKQAASATLSPLRLPAGTSGPPKMF